MTKRGWARQFAVPTRVCYTGEWYWAAYSG